jgi:hypothetical protein
MEKEFFSKAIDDPAAEALRAILARSTPLSADVRGAWVRFLLSLAFRHPKGIDDARTAGNQVLRKELSKAPEEYAAVKGNAPEATLLEFVETRMPGTFEDLGLTSLAGVINGLRLGQAIWEMNWYLLDLSQVDGNY